MAARLSSRASFLLVSLGLAAGCASIPALEYARDDDDASVDSGVAPGHDAGPDAGSDAAEQPDATLPPSDGGIFDAASLEDVAEPDDPDGGDAGIQCGDHTVPNCAQCAGKHLRCTLPASDTCVADCEACAVGWLPCFHCPNNGVARGRCVAPNAKGKISCTNANRCKCAGNAVDCPAAGNAAQTCVPDPDAGSADAGAFYCFTCGEAPSLLASCTRLDTTKGTCRTSASGPTCQ